MNNSQYERFINSLNENFKDEYEMKEDPIYETYKDKIIVFNGSTLITTYGKMFSVAS